MEDRHPGMDHAWREVYLELGILMVTASNLEQTIRSVLLTMLPGMRWDRTQLVIDGFSTGQARDRCARLAWEVLGGELRDEVLAWLKDAEVAQNERNGIVHSHWTSGQIEPDGSITHGPAATRERVTKPRLGLQRSTTLHSADSIAVVSRLCFEADQRGLSFLMELQEFWLETEEGRRGEKEKWLREERAATVAKFT